MTTARFIQHTITPNLTEACYLTGAEYRDTGKMSENDAADLAAKVCRKLGDLTDADIVITGIDTVEGKVGCYCYTEECGRFFSRPKVGAGYPGTGELFASVMLGRLLKRKSFLSSAEYAVDFSSPVREGVIFEPLLGDLANKND